MELVDFVATFKFTTVLNSELIKVYFYGLYQSIQVQGPWFYGNGEESLCVSIYEEGIDMDFIHSAILNLSISQ